MRFKSEQSVPRPSCFETHIATALFWNAEPFYLLGAPGGLGAMLASLGAKYPALVRAI